MKKLILLIFIVSCVSDSEKYELILQNLELNHTQLRGEMDDDSYFIYFKLNEQNYNETKLKYEKAVDKFFNSNPNIIEYLLSYEDEKATYCNWVYTKNPNSSTIMKSDLACV